VYACPKVDDVPYSILNEEGIVYAPTPGTSSGGSAGPDLFSFNAWLRANLFALDIVAMPPLTLEILESNHQGHRVLRNPLDYTAMLPDVIPDTPRIRTPGSARQTRNFGFAGGVVRIWPKMLKHMMMRRHLREWHAQAMTSEGEFDQVGSCGL